MKPSQVVAGHVRPAATTSQLATLLHWIFRVGFFMEFVGHGAFGIIGKSAWVPYFGVFGISEGTAWRLMPLIGSFDIFVGTMTLVRPMRAFLLYGAVWGLWTSLLRPLAGEAFWETLERAGNYGIPLAFLLWSGWPRRAAEWFERIEPHAASEAVRDRLALLVRVTLALLLIGHGGFGAFMNKAMLAQHWNSIGVHQLPLGGGPVAAAGWLDIALGIAVLVHPVSWLLIFIAFWKVACELLYPISGSPIWEFVERGGSYAAPLALLVLTAMRRAPEPVTSSAIQAESAPA